MTDADDALRALDELFADGKWRPLPGTAPGRVVSVRGHADGSVDTLVVKSGADATATRNDRRSLPVWRHTGTVEQVVAALRELPDPGEPGAPDVPIPSLMAERIERER